MEIGESVVAALRHVYDPCSIGQNVPVSIYDMGLIQGWDLDGDGQLTLRVILTSPLCMMSPHFLGAAREKLQALDGVRVVSVLLDRDAVWTPDLMTDEGRATVDGARRRSMAAFPVAPQEWKLAVSS
jgi:metal-sulfur cluster biosynthetic enzyme